MSVWAVYGPKGTGKSSFALTFPGKKYVFDLEFGAARAWGFEDADKTVWKPNTQKIKTMLTYKKGQLLQGMCERWQRFTEIYAEILTTSDHPVIVLDTHKEAWDWDAKAHLQELQEAQLEQARSKYAKDMPDEEIAQKINIRKSLIQIEYGIPNTRMNNLIDLARIHDKTLVLVNHERDDYVTVIRDGQPQSVASGKKTLDGYSKTLDRADWVLKTSAIDPVDGKGVVLCAVVEKSPVGLDLIGVSLRVPRMDYEALKLVVEAHGRKMI